MGIVTSSVRVAVLTAAVLGVPTAAAAEPAEIDATEVDASSVDEVEVPTVTLRPGAPEVTSIGPAPCNDALFMHESVDRVILERDGGADAALTVTLAEVGPAVPGVDHEPLPGTATFPAGSHELVIAVVPLPDTQDTAVELDVALRPGEGYTVGRPAEARLSFVRPQDPATPPTECGFAIAGGPDLARDTVVGHRPDPVVVEGMFIPVGFMPLEPDAYVVTITGGSLPAGLTLSPDGTFDGQATTVGRTEATLEACRVGSALDTCVTATLIVTVASATTRVDETEVLAEQLPVTGTETDLLLLGVVQLLAGTAILSRTRRRQTIEDVPVGSGVRED